jgi:hypothetical protein
MKSSISASPIACAAWSKSNHHGPLEVGDGAGYCVQTLERLTSPAVAEAQPSAELMVDPGCGARCATLGYWRAPDQADTIGLLPRSASLTQWRRGEPGRLALTS